MLSGFHAGTLVAFDRFLNLVLRDVEEEYTVLLRVKRVLPARGSTVADGPGVEAQTPGQPSLPADAQVMAGAASSHNAVLSRDGRADHGQRPPATAATGDGNGGATPLAHADVRTPVQSADRGPTEALPLEPPRTAFPDLNSQATAEDEQLLVFRSDWRPRQADSEMLTSPEKGSERSLASALTDSSTGRPSPGPAGSVRSLASALTDSDADEAPCGGTAAAEDHAMESTEADDASADHAPDDDAARLLYAESFRARAVAAQLSCGQSGHTASEQGLGVEAKGASKQLGGAADVGGVAGPQVGPCPANPGGDASSAQNSGERVRWVRKQDHRRRKLRQVFVRGDNVVLVSLVESPATLHQIPTANP